MRAAVFLTAHALKLYLRLRLMTTREWLGLVIAGSVALAIAILSERSLYKSRGEVYCSETAQEQFIEERCEFKLRSA